MYKFCYGIENVNLKIDSIPKSVFRVHYGIRKVINTLEKQLRNVPKFTGSKRNLIFKNYFFRYQKSIGVSEVCEDKGTLCQIVDDYEEVIVYFRKLSF